MIGRAALGNPCMLWDVDRWIYGDDANPVGAMNRHTILQAYCDYLDVEHPADGEVASSLGSGPTQGALKPVLGVFSGVTGNKILRQGIHDLSHDKVMRQKGPANILRKVIDMLATNPASAVYLFEPLKPVDANGGVRRGWLESVSPSSSIHGGTFDNFGICSTDSVLGAGNLSDSLGPVKPDVAEDVSEF